MSPRTFTCHGCDQTQETTTTRGRLPTLCDACDPEGARRRLAERRRSTELAMLRVHVHTLRERLRDLEGTRAQLLDAENPRLELARAVRAIGQAAGRDETRLALLRLRDVAATWANTLRNDEQRAA